jgi:predicted metal-dependent hydrolase
MTETATTGSTIVVRRMRFDLSCSKGALWNCQAPEISYLTCAWALALPHLEAYFIAAVRQCLPRISDPQLRSDAVAYCAQEGEHARHHRQFNRRLMREGYPGLEAIEARIGERLVRHRKSRSLRWHMAYTAGYEAVTFQIVRFFFRHRALWFERADPHVSAMLVWHGVEEVEHKNVAFDVYMALFGSYFWRCVGFVAALLTTVRDILVPLLYMWRVDGRLRGWRRVDRQFFRRQRALEWLHLRELLPELRHYLRPGYHPSHESDPVDAWRWMADHACGRSLEVLDTNDLGEHFRRPETTGAERRIVRREADREQGVR